jgi:phosphoglycolate phosphatase-like HAD superfamily hydrolase
VTNWMHQVKQRIIFDFDGTIVEAKKHDHAVYCATLASLDQPSLDIESYWILRRNNVPVREILARTTTRDVTEEFLKLRPVVYEDPRYDHLLSMVSGAREAIEHCSELYDCYLVTARFNILTTTRLCELYGIANNFVSMYAGNKHENFQMLRPIYASIGDAEKDIIAARDAHVNIIIAVTSGTRAREKLIQWNPTFLIDDLRDLPAVMKRVQTSLTM